MKLQTTPKVFRTVSFIPINGEAARPTETYRSLVENFDGVLVRDISFPESFFQGPKWERLPLSKNDQVNVTDGNRQQKP